MTELHLDYKKFLNDLQLPLDGKRLAVVTELFNKIQNEETKLVSKKNLFETFNADNHPFVKAGQYSRAQIQDMLTKAWQNAEGMFSQHLRFKLIFCLVNHFHWILCMWAISSWYWL